MYEPSSTEYKKALLAQLDKLNEEDLSFWLDKYVEGADHEYLQFYVQGADVCAKCLLKVENWTDKIAHIKRVKGKSYEGAEFKGLRFSVVEQGEEIELLYEDFERVID